MDGKKSIWTPANVVTLIRICLVPVFVVALLSPWPAWFGLHDIISDQVKSLLAACVFILISCTDWIDGYLARSRGEVTDFGKLIDPLADKILVAAALLALVELQVLPSWPVLIILSREFIVSGVRMLAASKGIIIAASWYGKAKTVLQIVAIVMFLIKDTLALPTADAAIHSPLYIASWLVMLAALALTVISMVDYVSKAWPMIKRATEAEQEGEGQDDPACMRERIESMAEAVVREATDAHITISTAESLTGGMISTSLTSIPGSSSAFSGGVVSYATSLKAAALGVDEALLAERGAVDGTVAEQMALGVARLTSSDVAIAVTGIAGPGGAEPGKPVGTVFMGMCASGDAWVRELHLSGDRTQVRERTTLEALRELHAMIGRSAKDAGNRRAEP